MASVGMNLEGFTYWTYEEPFIDHFKSSTPWMSYGGSGPNAAVPLDANGNPLSVPAGVHGLYTLVGVDPENVGKTNIYEITYSGVGTIDVGAGAQIIAATPGHITVQMQPTNTRFQIYINADSTTDPVHDFHVVRQDQVGLFQSGEMFNPDFIAKTSQWDTLRFMDWGETNTSTVSNWADRTTLTDSSWSTGKGVPIEAMIKLCNEAHTDMWFNVPTDANDDYVRNALQLIKANLDPSLKVKIEYSNEVWNWGFSQAHYAQDQANQLWGHDTNGNGTIDGAETVSGGNDIYYGYRSAQIAGIAHQVFGGSDASRLIDVLAGQTVNTSITPYFLQGIAAANQGSVGSLFSQYAVTTYFGWQFGFPTTAADQSTIYQWATSGAAGKDAAFQELQHGGALSTNASLDAMVAYYAADAAFAHSNGMNLVAYEGGSDLESVFFPADEQATIKAFFASLTDDPRMGALYTKMLQDFSAAGGTSVQAFNDVGSISEWGDFGALANIYQNGTARYEALTSYATSHNVAHGYTTVSAAATSSPLANAHSGLITGTSGDDQMAGSSQNDTIDGAAGNDLILGSSSSTDGAGHLIESDVYVGGAGADTIVGGSGNDHIYGNAVNTTAGSVDGADSLSGGGGNDYVQGNAGNDTIDGGDGNDRLYGGADNDSILGGFGQDYLQGNKGSDTLSGGDGNDSIHGGADADRLAGDAGNDQVFGDAGNDTIVGGAGLDTLTGGAGNDTFIFGTGDAAYVTSGANAWSVDEIVDFTGGADHVGLTFHPVQVLQGTAASIAAAANAASQMLQAHSGEHDVAAVAVGSDTYLFWNDAGTGSTINAAVKLDHVSAVTLMPADFV